MFVFRYYCRLHGFFYFTQARMWRHVFIMRQQDVLLTYFNSQNTPTPLTLALGIWKMRQYAFHLFAIVSLNEIKLI